MSSLRPPLRIVVGRPKARRAGLLAVVGGALALAALLFPLDRSWMALPLAVLAGGSFVALLFFLRFETPRSMLISNSDDTSAVVPVEVVDSAASERAERLQVLGVSRLRILGCLGGDFPSQPHYFAPAPGEDVLAAFRAFVEGRVRDAHDDRDRLTQALLGAARLLIGDLAGADTVLEQLPDAPMTRSRRLPPMVLAPAQTVSAALPLTSLELAPASAWVAGSNEQTRVRTWLHEHRSQLVWNERRAVYELLSPAAAGETSAASGHSRNITPPT
jgi:hypothetical protein